MNEQPPARDTPTTASQTSGNGNEVAHKQGHLQHVWILFVGFVLLLLLLFIFIFQNSKMVEVYYFGGRMSIGLGVAILGGAIVGSLLTVLVGSTRIIQLRARRARQ